MMKRLTSVLAGFALVLAIAPFAQAAGKMLSVGDTLPMDLDVTLLSGAAPVKLGTVLGKTKYTAIVFMNTACSSCMQEMEGMLKLGAETKNLTLVPVAVDVRGKEAVDRYLTTYEKYKDLSFVLDSKYALAYKFGFSATPASVIVDGNGKIVAREAGWSAETSAAIEKIVKGK